MNRTQKQLRLAEVAKDLVQDLTYGGNAYFGNDGVTLYTDGGYGDVVGYVIHQADLTPKNRTEFDDPSNALAAVLGVNRSDLPTELIGTVNQLATVSDNTKRAYSRRVPALIKTLNKFASLMASERISRNSNSLNAQLTNQDVG